MTSLVYLIEQLSRGVYLLCVLGILINFRRWLIAQRELSDAEFELERELGVRRQASAITWTLGLIEVILGIYAVANVIAPTLRNDLTPLTRPITEGVFITAMPGQATIVNDQGTPIANISINDAFATGTANPQTDPNNQILTTPIPSATVPGTIEAGPTTPPIGCQTDDARLLVPASNQVVFESVTVVGTAQTKGFTHYRFELNGPSTGNAWVPYGGDHTTQVTTVGVMANLSMQPFAFGTYLFRLVVFDQANALKASCTIKIFIRQRPPTPTPFQNATGTP